MTELVVDTSAVVAIINHEPGWNWLAEQLLASDEKSISAPNLLELGMVLEGRAIGAEGIARRFLNDSHIWIEPFDEALTERAIQAWRRFGKGRHRAALNFGDCCTYALAAHKAQPILCIGNDFVHTDLQVLMPPPPEPTNQPRKKES